MVREPHHGVVAVTGRRGGRRVQRHRRVLVVQHGDRSLPGLPVPADGDDIGRAHRAVPRPAADARAPRDLRSTGAHRPPRPADAADHAEAPQGERGVHVGARRPSARRVPFAGRCEFIKEYAGRSPCWSWPTCSACRRPITSCSATGWARSVGDIATTDDEWSSSNPLEFLDGWFSSYVEDRRRARDDVLSGLATATFPDGSIPDVLDVVRIATFLFAAGQETTARLLSSALQLIAENPDIQQRLATSVTASRTSSRKCCAWRAP